MTRSNREKKAHPVWRLFCSLRLTLSLLIILAITSVAGTVIPQQEEAIEFARRLSPALFKLFSSLQLFDMYHSNWFRFMIALLSINLIVCSLDRLPKSWKLFRTKPSPDRLTSYENLPEDRLLTVTGKMKEIGDRVAYLLSRRYKGLERKGTEKGEFFYAERGRYSYFGVYLVHLSVLIILLGAIVGSLLGFEAYVNIPEGERIDSVRLRKSMKPKALGFSVACEKFTVEFYENGAPKEFKSDLKFIEDGKVVLEGSLLVNHPITFRGISFYQSSYGGIPGKHLRLSVVRHGTDNNPSGVEVEVGKRFPLEGGEGHFQVLEVDDNLRGVMGPAALISVIPEEGKEVRFWIFQQLDRLKAQFPDIMLSAPILNPAAFKPYTFYLEEIEKTYFTGLQVNRDPGVPLVWIGCFLMVAGFFLTFFTSHRRLMIHLSETGNTVRLAVAGRTNKNPIGFERELVQVAMHLRDHLTERGKQDD